MEAIERITAGIEMGCYLLLNTARYRSHHSKQTVAVLLIICK